MRVMVIVKASERSEAGEMPDSKMLEAMGEFNEQLAKAGVLLAGEGLHASSRGARLKYSGAARPAVVDGPFAETKELVGGFWILQVKSMGDAIEWLSRAPFGNGDEIEIRPLVELDDFGEALTPELREKEIGQRMRIGERS